MTSIVVQVHRRHIMVRNSEQMSFKAMMNNNNNNNAICIAQSHALWQTVPMPGYGNRISLSPTTACGTCYKVTDDDKAKCRQRRASGHNDR